MNEQTAKGQITLLKTREREGERGWRYLDNIFFLFLHENICCGYSLETPHSGALDEYHNICFCGEIRKIPVFFFLFLFFC